jgi:signal transduction histidine kinase
MARLWRLIPIIALVTVAAFLVTGIGMALYVDRSNVAQRLDETEVQAQTLAATVPAALSFNDRQAAEEYVNAIRADPDIQQAAVYDNAGLLFAGWSRGGPLPVVAEFEPPHAEAGHLIVTAPVVQGGSQIGVVYLQCVTEPLAQRLQRYGIIGLLIGMAIVVVSVLAITQAALTRANAELAGRARDLAAANENLRDEIAQRERVEEALRQAQKMEAIGQLTGGVAHDFNNLLQVIKGNLEMMLRRHGRAGAEPELVRMGESALRASDRAAMLTQRLLAFARRQPLAPTPIDANQLVAGMSDLLGRTLGEAVNLQTVGASGLWQTLADANQLESALLNLAVNARDAMPHGGTLTIETANAHLDEAYAQMQQPEDLRAGQYVMVAVTDTGHGMAPEVLRKVFEPFFTTKEIGQGTGLGLSQVYGFVRQSGGHVKIYSEPGQGTTVRLYLPRLLASDTDSDESGTQREVPATGGSETVLVAEDEDDVRTFTVATLRELGYRVLPAADGHAALRLLRIHTGIDLLFTDIGLPGALNGSQLADVAKALLPDLRVLLTTGYAPNAVVNDGRVDPGMELVAKPFTQAELARKVREVLDR